MKDLTCKKGDITVKKSRSLKDIELEEVSLVDLAANKRKFLFFKRGKSDDEGHADSVTKQRELKVSIESDGTEAGTKILVNGKEIDGIESFYFDYWKPRGVELDGKRPASIGCSYSKIVEAADTGFKRTETFHLSKGEIKMDKEILELVKEYLGEEFKEEEFTKVEKLSDEAVKAIKDALKLVNKYKADFPDDLSKAVAVLVRYAGYGYGYPAKEGSAESNEDGNNNDEGVFDKSGKKLSKETLKKLVDALKAIQSVLPEDTKVKKSATEEPTKDDALKEIKEAIEKMATSTQGSDEKLKEITDSITEVTKRLEVVEKTKGIKKSIESQDDDDDKTNVQKGAGEDGKVLWPSLVGKKKTKETKEEDD